METKISRELLDSIVAEVQKENSEKYKQSREDIKDCMKTLLREGTNNIFQSDLELYIKKEAFDRNSYTSYELLIMLEEIKEELKDSLIDSEIYSIKSAINILKEDINENQIS